MPHIILVIVWCSSHSVEPIATYLIEVIMTFKIFASYSYFVLLFLVNLTKTYYIYSRHGTKTQIVVNVSCNWYCTVSEQAVHTFTSWFQFINKHENVSEISYKTQNSEHATAHRSTNVKIVLLSVAFS